MSVGDGEFLRDLYNVTQLFGDKWTLAIVSTLAHGPMRRVEILTTINSYSVGEDWSDKHGVLHDSILTKSLKKMTAEGLLVRTRHAEIFPPKVYYSLTRDALEFLKAADPVIEWARSHADLIARAQAYRRNHGDDGATAGVAELDVVSSGSEDDHPDTDEGNPAGSGAI
jgi:DNA-binding HxlR family transcriptional regulator